MAPPLSSVCGLLPLVVLSTLVSQSCYGFHTLGFEMHHRYSDSVKGILGIDELPAKGSREYYVAMSHRDRLVRGRGLADMNPSALTFAAGNDTLRIASLGFLHYANVSIGTPPVWFLVALDTGSDLFWLPCNCTEINCVHALRTRKGQRLDLNIYDPQASSTSKNVLCNSTLCSRHHKQCPSSNSTCPYQVRYLTSNTSSSGVLVEDVLHLVTDDDQTKQVNARINFGYNISITQIIVGTKAVDFEFNAIFDTGTSFTYLNDPAYSNITSNFNSMVKGKRYLFDSHPDSMFPFEYCYENTMSNHTSLKLPFLNLTMKEGDNYFVTDPLVVVDIEDVENVTTVICLGIVKSDDFNIIGQNFMTGYHIVFDRDNMILGWKNSSCYDDEVSKTSAVNTAHSPAVSPAVPLMPQPAMNQSDTFRPQLPSHSSKIKPFVVASLLALFSGFAIF